MITPLVILFIIVIIPFQISLFSPYMKKKFLLQLKNMKNNHSSTSDSLEYVKSCILKKTRQVLFLKFAPYMRILKSLDLTRD